MGPERTLSEAGKVVGALGKQLRAKKEIPADSLQAFISLLEAYSKVVEAVTPERGASSGKGGKLTREAVERYIEKHGIPGAYESMCEGAK